MDSPADVSGPQPSEAALVALVAALCLTEPPVATLIGVG
jgi:hypothetical protein